MKDEAWTNNGCMRLKNLEYDKGTHKRTVGG